MSRSTPVCRLKCSQCQKGATDAERYGNAVRSYIDVAIVGVRGERALCRCRRCGHEYESKSMAAKRAMRRFAAAYNKMERAPHAKQP